MIESSVCRSVSIFFYAGDFVDVLRRHASGDQQIYATHAEVAQLIHDLRAANVEVTIYSYLSPEPRDERPIDGVRIVSLGATGNSRGVLSQAVANVASDMIIAHFAFPELLKAAIASGKRVFAGLANSYNERGVKQRLRRWRMAHLLNNPRIAMVTNHCVPATEHLAEIGVKRSKLVPWDVPHAYNPDDWSAKRAMVRDEYNVAYAGSILESKGVGDLIRAIALLKAEGFQVRASFAGLGEIEGMRALGTSLGVADRLDFRGIVGNADVFAMMRDADITAVPSQTSYPEGFPLTMFEAIASRSPIVCTDHPMFRRIMKDETAAAVFASGDSRGCANAIRRVLTDADLYARLSDASPQTWQALRGPANWRTLLTKWVLEGETSPWVAQHKLDRAS